MVEPKRYIKRGPVTKTFRRIEKGAKAAVFLSNGCKSL